MTSGYVLLASRGFDGNVTPMAILVGLQVLLFIILSIILWRQR